MEVDRLELWAGRLRLGGAVHWALVGTIRAGPDPGIFVGVSALFLDGEGRPLQHDGKKVRRTFGGPAGVRGGTVRLGAAGDHVVVVEGIEDALASLALGLGTAWASCGASGMSSASIPLSVRHVTIVRDADAAGRAAARSLQRRLLDGGRAVDILEPDAPAGDVAAVWERQASKRTPG